MRSCRHSHCLGTAPTAPTAPTTHALRAHRQLAACPSLPIPSPSRGRWTCSATRRCKVSCSFQELYREVIVDLLAPPTAAPPSGGLPVREDPAGGVYVAGLSTHAVGSAAEVLACLQRGASARYLALIYYEAVQRTLHHPISVVSRLRHGSLLAPMGHLSHVWIP